MKERFPVISLLKKPFNLTFFGVIAGGFFYLSYYLMANLPGEWNYMCVMGAALTPGNIAFSIAMSLLSGLVITGFLEGLKVKSLSRAKVGSASAVGVLTGILTTFCTLCALPVISFFGAGISLAVFTDYEIWFKMLSLLLLGLSAFLINRQLQQACKVCAY